MTHYRLEYNPDDGGLFNMDNYTHKENTSGWATIDDRAEDQVASRFINYFKAYHLDKRHEPNEVKSMWEMFKGD